MKESPRKLVLIGGGQAEAEAYRDAARRQGREMQHFSSMGELGYLGRMREFDAAIVYQDLMPLTGLELAEYLEKLFARLPMVLLAEDPDLLTHHSPDFPKSVVSCCDRAAEPAGVLRQLTRVMGDRQLTSVLS